MLLRWQRPFGEREHHPYKVWLRERKLFFAQHGLPRNGKNKTDKEQLDDLITMMMSAKRGSTGKRGQKWN